MTAAAAAGSLLLAALAAPPEGRPAVIDFGSAAPGHDYHYATWFRNSSGSALSIVSEEGRCAGCPGLRMGYRSLGPGDSARVTLHYHLPADAPDTVDQAVTMTVYQSGYRDHSYRLRFRLRPPAMVRPGSRTVGLAASGDGSLRGTVTLANLTRRRLEVSAEGLPDGIDFGGTLPARLAGGRDAVISFNCQPEVLLHHRSITLRVDRADRKGTERLSLPLAPE